MLCITGKNEAWGFQQYMVFSYLHIENGGYSSSKFGTDTDVDRCNDVRLQRWSKTQRGCNRW